MSAPRVVLVDRDGVVNQLVARPPDGHGESPLHPREVRLTEDAPGCLRRLRAAGYLLGCVTNQPAAAKGMASVEDIDAVHAEVQALLTLESVSFDASRVCLHHPDAAVTALRGSCSCRKPAPGMLLGILEELGADAPGSWMIGDTDTDILAGQRAGVRTVLVQDPSSSHKRFGDVHPDAAVATLTEAMPMLLAAAPGRYSRDR